VIGRVQDRLAVAAIIVTVLTVAGMTLSPIADFTFLTDVTRVAATR
jgi:hypothetical protein